MSYCALDEAFLTAADQTPLKRHKKVRPKVPGALPDVPQETTEKVDDVLAAPISSPDVDFFPASGNPGGDSWETAFKVENDYAKTVQRPVFDVDGKNTLWRKIDTPSIPIGPSSASASALSGSMDAPTYNQSLWKDMNKRLDTLTKQLENLTVSSPGPQSTAELFLFVAIGLILLLAIDTLLRFATAAKASSLYPSPSMAGGARLFRSRGRIR